MQRVTLHLLHEFLRLRPDLKIDVVVAVAGGECQEQLPDSVKLVDLATTFDFRTKSLLKFVPKLRQYLKEQQPQVVLSCLPAFNFLTILASLGISGKTRFLLAEHALSFDRWLAQEQGDSKLPAGFLPKLSPWLMRYTYPRANKIITVSEGIAGELSQSIGVPAAKLQVIYNPVVDESTRTKAKAPLTHPWFEPGQPPVFLAVGRLMKQKDYPSLIRAFGQLRQKHSARLLILGEGDLRSQLTKLIHQLDLDDAIAMPGFAANPYAYMSHAAAFVLSSVWETFGVVLVEALACGCPIISTDCDYGPREILERGKYGTLVPVRDIDALAAAMANTLVGKPHDRANLIARSQAFTVEKAAVQYLHTLDACL